MNGWIIDPAVNYQIFLPPLNAHAFRNGSLSIYLASYFFICEPINRAHRHSMNWRKEPIHRHMTILMRPNEKSIIVTSSIRLRMPPLHRPQSKIVPNKMISSIIFCTMCARTSSERWSVHRCARKNIIWIKVGVELQHFESFLQLFFII